MSSGIIGPGTSDFVKNNYQLVIQLIVEMQQGELVDLIGRTQVTLGVKEDKAREYVFGAISSRWIEVSNQWRVIDTLEAKMSMKYLRPVHFRSILGKMEKRFNVDRMEYELRPEEKPETPFTDWAEKRELEKAREKLRSLK